MIRHSFAQRAVIAVSFMGILPLLLLGCPKKPPPPVEVPDAAPAPEVDSAPTVLTPLDEMDAGDGGEAEAPKHTYHPPVNGNAAAIKRHRDGVHSPVAADRSVGAVRAVRHGGDDGQRPRVRAAAKHAEGQIAPRGVPGHQVSLS